ncbi:MAG: helix-turn-helix transcriptional regulator [Streptomyces sp.]|nr:helix-turn-helix transcriptional regulator [Streptomyces sp.]
MVYSPYKAPVTRSGTRAKDHDLRAGVLGRLVRARRKERSLSQADLADRAGIDIAYLRRVERGDDVAPGLLVMQALSQELDVCVGELAA